MTIGFGVNVCGNCFNEVAPPDLSGEKLVLAAYRVAFTAPIQGTASMRPPLISGGNNPNGSVATVQILPSMRPPLIRGGIEISMTGQSWTRKLVRR